MIQPKKVFMDFHDSRGDNLVEKWIETLPKRAQEKLRSVLVHLSAEPNWAGSRYVHALSGEGNGLIEIRVVFSGVQYRPIAFHGPGRGEVTIVCGAVEKDDKLYPPSTCQIGQKRKQLAQNDRSRINEHDI